MIAIFRRVINKEIVKVFTLTAISTVIKMITGFISVKLISALIGPAGIALLGQLSNFSSIFLTISTGGINSGVTKYVSEYSGSKIKIKQILRTSVWIAGTMSILSGLTLIIGSSFFSKIILHDSKYTSVITIFGITIIFYAFNSLLLSILNGYKEFRKYVTINIISSFVGLLFTGTLAFFFGVYGALLAAVTFESVILIVTIVAVARVSFFSKSIFFGKFSKQAGSKLAHYSLMALISAATIPVSQLIIRSNIVEYSSLTEAGLWEAMNRLSAMYLLVITSSLSVYYLPRLSEITTEPELRQEVISTYKIVIPPLVVVVSVIYLLRDFIIVFVFNDKFQGMQSLFAFQLIGDFFKIGSWIIAYLMLARSMTKTYVTTEILSSLFYIGIALINIRFFGTIGATMGYAVTYIVYFIAMLVIFRKLIFIKK